MRSAVEVSVKVITDDAFRRHQGFDLAPVEGPALARTGAAWNERLCDVQARLGLAAGSGRLRVVIQRQNRTCRPAWSLGTTDEMMTLQQIKDKWGSARERCLVFYVEQVPAGTSLADPTRSLVFLKRFDYHAQTLLGAYPVYVNRTDPVRALNRVVCETEGWGRGVLMAYYEEIQPGMVEPLSLNATFQEAEIDTGDVICFERLDDDDGTLPAGRRTHFRNAVGFYRFLAAGAAAAAESRSVHSVRVR